MKLKINKACDLSSISVLPPQSRRSSVISSGLDTSAILGGSQTASKLQLQPLQHSQRSLSQGVSSQHLSQFSQNSQGEGLLNEKIGSQERENSIRRTSYLPPMSHTQEESGMIVSRASNNVMRKWSSQEYKCQNSEELDNRIGMMETSLSRLGMILDSVQNDIMQVNKVTKEVALEMEGVRQKLIVHEDSVHSISRVQEDIKTQLDMGLKSVTDQLKQIMNQEMLGDVVSMLSSLSEKIDTQLHKFQNELHNKFCKEIQEISSNIKMSQQRQSTSSAQRPKAVTFHASPEKFQFLSSSTRVSKAKQTRLAPKVEMGGWTLVKQEQATTKYGNLYKRNNHMKSPPNQSERQIVIDSDEECFSCLYTKNGTGMDEYSTEEAMEETARILRKARRKRRKFRNTIIIN
ncbi:putative recombination initiation defects 3 [Andrographis paniculata]|uniref:putative recombination initiation defects 3 n=1 Tax=Andrographis paniculata TaxID=175694 RepID=UPI0021E73DC9|nr:putative recombination initiation defects 3 [Andrographis paniculata]